MRYCATRLTLTTEIGYQKAMTQTHANFDPQTLCSRKLWEIVNRDSSRTLAEADLQAAIQELQQRRHYLEELTELGKLA